MSEKYKKKSNYLIYVQHFLILVSTVTGCVSTSAFASLVFVIVGITSFGAEIIICAVTAGIKKYKSTISKNEKRNMIK